MKRLIFEKLDRIELRTRAMAHEIPEIAEKLRQWQDGQLKDSFFSEFLNKYLDKLSR